MTRNGKIVLACAAVLLPLAACATVGGSVVGAGIGALAGDARTGAAVGATAGAVVDLFGRD
ncbi:hypothetical protein [Altererythrobacter sp.]|uniref:hypothetical protein n=1 Tax=Altererythrobacter sp. TaxID=1872480 RepID=UPI003D0952BC